MSKAADLRKRLEAVTARMNGTFAARLAKLTPHERAIYDDWKARTAAYHNRSDAPGSSYARLLSGDYPPALPRTIRTALFGPTPVITSDMTEADAAETYRRFALDD
jgi:hypothetical protein